MGEPTVRPRATSLFALALPAAMAACGGEGGASSGEGSGAPRQASAGSRATASGAGPASTTSPEELAAPTRSERRQLRGPFVQ
ncbi:MAG: hypothetical protein IPG04_10555 [Polyangiaceae bacterium]|nr:hypothetical protein [Polyangiaceae bacterium]